MASIEYHHDLARNEGIITFRIPDREVISAEIGPIGLLFLATAQGSVIDHAMKLLVILEGIEAAKEKKKRNAARQN